MKTLAGKELVMLSVQTHVEEFHRKFGHPHRESGGKIKLRHIKLRRRLIKEESKEMTRALKRGDEVEVIDAACDLMYVTLGTVIAMGIDLEPFWNAVHSANMAKEGGGKRDDGKVLRPEGWQPPDIENILASQKAARERELEQSSSQRWEAGVHAF